MTAPWDQGIDDDDFVEGIDDEEDEELGIDYTARHGGAMPSEDMPAERPTAVPRARPAQRPHNRQQAGGRKFRVRPMGARMAARNQDVTSILITKSDGSQVLLVRR